MVRTNNFLRVRLARVARHIEKNLRFYILYAIGLIVAAGVALLIIFLAGCA